MELLYSAIYEDLELMFSRNPFADVSAYISTTTMETFIIVMVLLVVFGTLYDVIHKKSAQYFFENWKRSKNKGSRQVGAGEVAALTAKTVYSEVLTSSEFCNPKRRIAHLLTMYGFIAYVVSTVALVFNHPYDPSPMIWPVVWHIGALMTCIGGYWFWFFIRVDVAAEGHSPFRIVKADLFVLSLLASTTLALIWSFSQATGHVECSRVCFGLYILATIVLFAGVPWSKFAHMFFKPAAALQKKVAEADGSRNNLPPPVDAPAKYHRVRKQPNNY